MRMCEYGSGCTRPDCIYRHDESKKADEICLPFLAGKCTFTDEGCRKCHPSKEAKERLIAKYKRTRCRFGDDCYTESCLYLHPNEVQQVEPMYIEPHHVAFPPLNGKEVKSAPKAPGNSAWKAAPPPAPVASETPTPTPPMVMAQPAPCVPTQSAMWYPAPIWGPQYEMDPAAYYQYEQQAHEQQGIMPSPGVGHPAGSPMNFNVNAKEFVPGGSA